MAKTMDKRNVTLESDVIEGRGMYPASQNDTKRYADQTRSMFGTAAMPPVLYKGKLIPQGLLGTRDLTTTA